MRVWYTLGMKRQEYWKSKGYTQEQIENHLQFERRKSKESRDRRNKNNLKNKEIIEQIKKEMLHVPFNNCYVLSINPTVDGKGFYYKYRKTFGDGSVGDFRDFMDFDSYSLEYIKENLR